MTSLTESLRPCREQFAANTFARFQDKFKVSSDNSCWTWIGAKNSRGYGHFAVNGTNMLAHRFSYMWYVGEIPDGLTIDHQCNNRLCVNPDHLKAMTLKENILRSSSIMAANSRKTHCSNGHELAGANLQLKMRKDGMRRICRKCKNTRTALEQPTNDVERVRERWRRIGDEWDRAKEAALTQKNEGDL